MRCASGYAALTRRCDGTKMYLLKIMTTQEKIRKAKAAILQRDELDSFADIIAREKDAFLGLRVLFASDVSGGKYSI